MPSLLDHIDRFAYTAQQIQAASQQVVSSSRSGPFVRAILHTRLGDLARDIDASELGLFSLDVPPAASSSAGTGAAADDAVPPTVGALTRAEFAGATPLRKPTGARERERVLEKEPEVYAEAALKYLDKYIAIRPMPRARQEVEELINRLNSVREEISSLGKTMEQKGLAGSSPKSSVKEEEKRVQQLQSRIKQLKARKEVLHRKQQSSTKPTPKGVAEEDAFWGGPGTDASSSSHPRQSLHLPSEDDSLLLDSIVDIGDVSMDTMSEMPTPLPTHTRRLPVPVPKPDPPLVAAVKPTASDRASIWDAARKRVRESMHQVRDESQQPIESRTSTTGRAPANPVGEELEDEAADDEGDQTVVLAKPPMPSPPPSPRPVLSIPKYTQPLAEPVAGPSTPPREEHKDVPTTTPARTPGVSTPATSRRSKRRITTDTERIVAKIWSTVGELLMPGHPFNTAAAATTNKPPRAKETIALLESIASKSPPPASPSTHSTLSLTAEPPSASQPTVHQILVAHLLFALLNRAPDYSMPLAKAKEALAERGLGTQTPPASGPRVMSLVGVGLGGGQAQETRALYGCVAKRLLKIDRGGREQVVRFDV